MHSVACQEHNERQLPSTSATYGIQSKKNVVIKKTIIEKVTYTKQLDLLIHFLNLSEQLGKYGYAGKEPKIWVLSEWLKRNMTMHPHADRTENWIPMDYSFLFNIILKLNQYDQYKTLKLKYILML